MKKLWQMVGVAAFWLSRPALRVYLRKTERTRVIITAEGKVLLVKTWLGSGDWMLPGGGIHKDEEPAAAAIREVYEETGIRLQPADLKFSQSLLPREYNLTFKCSVFTAELAAALPLKAQKGEIIEVAWFNLKDLPKLSPLTGRLVLK